jgi:hypothetical protein
LLSSIQVNDRGKAAPAVPYRRSDLVRWPDSEVRGLGRRSAIWGEPAATPDDAAARLHGSKPFSAARNRLNVMAQGEEPTTQRHEVVGASEPCSAWRRRARCLCGGSLFSNEAGGDLSMDGARMYAAGAIVVLVGDLMIGVAEYRAGESRRIAAVDCGG